MVSSDIRVVINGQEFVVSGSMLKPAPSNFQQEVLRRLDGIESRLGVIETEVTIIKHDQASLQTSVYWGFALMGLIVALLSLWLSSSRAKQRASESQPTPPQTLQPILIQIPPSAYEPKPHSEKSA